MPIILATQEAEIRRTVVQNHPRQIVHEALSRKNPEKKRAGGVVQFKPLYLKTKQNKNYDMFKNVK
jgi:hypothetical protein